MTSAFDPPHSPRLARPSFSPKTTLPPPVSLESETEDEEVKFNCIGGLRGMDDESDMNTTGSYDDSEDEAEVETTTASLLDRRVGVVNFVSRLLRPSPRIIKPAASRRPTLSPPLEVDEEDEEEEQQPEVGARGVALPFDESEDEQDDEDDDDDDDDDTDDDSDSDMDEQETVSGSDADESDMEEEDEEELDEEEPTLERPNLEGFSQEDETASVILQALEEEDDEEISSLIDSSSPGTSTEPLLMDEESAVIGCSHAILSRRPETHLIGVAQDREDDLVTVPRVKRVLSLDETLLSQHDVLPTDDVVTKKRRKSDADDDGLLTFTLGPPAMTVFENTTPGCRFLSPTITSSEELEDEDDLEEELDGQLRYELESTASSGGDQSPVPLLTPPESPVMGETCEWPSNLVVDSALTAVLSQIRPLDAWSEVEEEQQARGPCFTSSELTPLFRGIQVSDP